MTKRIAAVLGTFRTCRPFRQMSAMRGQSGHDADSPIRPRLTRNGHWAENLIKSIESSPDRATSNVMA